MNTHALETSIQSYLPFGYEVDVLNKNGILSAWLYDRNGVGVEVVEMDSYTFETWVHSQGMLRSLAEGLNKLEITRH